MRASRGLRDADRVPAVVSVNPGDGATGVFRDSPVAVRLSTPVDPGTLGPSTLRVQEVTGPVPGHLALCADAQLVVFQPARWLRPHVIHFVIVSGLTDRRGRSVRPHWSRFVPCSFTHQDLMDQQP
jgi:Bacterial Ig-like domain